MAKEINRNTENNTKKNKGKKGSKIRKIAAIAAAAVITAGVTIPAICLSEKGKLPKDPVPKDFSDYITADECEKTNATDTRVMSANLLVHFEDWGGSAVPPRAKMFTEVMNKYQPDVLGVQELCDDWYCCLAENMPKNYKFLNGVRTLLSLKYTAIIYNSDTVKVVEKGSVNYAEGTDRRTRRIEWALFERLDNGKQFIATSTHFDLLHKDKIEEELPRLKSEADELIAFADSMKEKYGCSVIITGDYNSMEDTPKTTELDAKEIYIKLSEHFIDSKNNAYKAKSGNGLSLSEPTYDHIFTNGDNKITAFRILSDLSFKDMSDHYPIYADFEIN